MKAILTFVLFFWGFSISLKAQLILGGNDPVDILTHSLTGSGVQISNVQYTGSPQAISYFQASTFYMNFHAGLLMSTGSVWSAPGPNTIMNNPGTDFSLPGDIELEIYEASLTPSRDAARIDFDVIPAGDSLKFNYQFASEEYPLINGYANDMFIIAISGNQYPNFPNALNIAKLPYSNAPVCIRNIDETSPYYLDNTHNLNPPYSTNEIFLQYNGLSVPLKAKVKVTPGLTYHVTFLIADLYDGRYDSAVFLEEGSVTAALNENELARHLSIYYSPSDETTQIRMDDMKQLLTLQLIDLTGKVILEKQLTDSDQLDMTPFEKGVYLVNLNNGKEYYAQKIMYY